MRVDESVWLSGLDLVAHDVLNRGDGVATLDRIATRLEVP